MAADAKVKAIKEFLAGLQGIRQDVKDDAIKLLDAMPLSVLANVDDLEQYLTEMVTTISRRHLIDKGKVRPNIARLIRKYVRELVR